MDEEKSAKGKSLDAAATLQAFGECAEAVAATTKKLQKAAILGDYLKTLSDPDLTRAARYFAGQQFAQNDARTTNVGGSIISAALSEATGFSPEDLYPRWVRLGDPGDLAEEIVKEAHKTREPTITLAEAESLISRLSETRGIRNKTALLAAVLHRATPLEAKYLVKLLASDLRIGLREGLVEDAIARVFGQSLADVAYANMLLGDIGETATRARRADLRDVSMRLFHPIKFMLATPAADLTDIARTMPEEFLVEDKFDGIRAQAHVANGRVAIYSRTMDEITHRFPELVDPLRSLPTDVIIDGEIVPASDEAFLPFSELQKRLGRKTVGTQLLQAVPVILVAYDLLYADGKILIDEPLAERRRILEELAPGSGPLRLSQGKIFTEASLLDEEFDRARARGNEGLMIKSPSSLYKPGRRGREWLKLKRAIATLDVAVTAVEVGHGRRRHLLSDYTFAVRRSNEEEELLNIGKAYSGLTDQELLELTEWFKAHTLQEFAHGRVRVVEPKIVIEVTFDRVQPSKRHNSGYALRFPRILRLRPDKTAREIDTLETVRRLVEGG
ncbi:MAG: ATP-dependent DNA ligase [Acidobacteria bacterium]|nr:ATP-dependent DNA ligase [Acidobacteriota bacterium]MCA1627178.1 ATP-dependent DNA ligase [Acidobacteriota bacterium]